MIEKDINKDADEIDFDDIYLDDYQEQIGELKIMLGDLMSNSKVKKVYNRFLKNKIRKCTD